MKQNLDKVLERHKKERDRIIAQHKKIQRNIKLAGLGALALIASAVLALALTALSSGVVS